MKSLLTTLCVLIVITATSTHARSPEARKILFESATKKLKDSKIEAKVPKVGDTFPDLSLGGQKVSNLVMQGPLVVTFYRGGWCPYCVTQLKEINDSISELKASKAQLIAISPEREKEVQKTKKKNNLTFTLLSDPHNKIAKEFNLVYKVEDEVVKEYQALGIDLEASQGNKDYELPMPATFVVNQKRKIIFAFADADYTKRAKTSEIVQAVKEAK